MEVLEVMMVIMAVGVLAFIASIGIWNYSDDKRRKGPISRFNAWEKKCAGAFVVNKVGKTIGVCRREDFERTLAEYEGEIKDGKRNPWGKTILFVRPTFVFSSGDNPENAMHVGGETDFAEIGKCLFHMQSDISEKEGQENLPNHCGWDSCLRDIMSRSDSRLFVPFVGESIFSFEEQARMYPRVTIEDARRHLIQWDDNPLSIEYLQ